MQISRSYNLPVLLWLWVPLGFAVFHLTAQAFINGDFLKVLTQEDGIYENTQFFIIAAAFLTAVMTLVRLPAREKPLLFGWIALAALCSFYVAAEEISWGQRIIGWDTPESWLAINDHKETNLHNSFVLGDKVPRIVLEVAICLGALPIALLAKYKPEKLPVRFAPIYPPPVLAVTAGILLFMKIVKPVCEQFELYDFQRLSEVMELYMYYFVWLYLVALKRRAKSELLPR